MRGAGNFNPQTIVTIERTALDRWGHGDPQGYLDLYPADVTYFDPALPKRIDGVEGMRKYYATIRSKIKADRYDMIAPVVQHHGDVAVLTYNLVDYGKKPSGTDAVLARWNSTKVYARIDGQWKIIHDHWSYVKPDLKQPSGE